MKREDLFAAINDIRDEFIEEANPDHAVRRETSHRLRPWLGMAAMLVVVIGIVTLAGKSGLWSAKSSQDSAASTAAPSEAAVEEYCVDGESMDSMEKDTAGGEVADGTQESVEESAPAEEEPAEGETTAANETILQDTGEAEEQAFEDSVAEEGTEDLPDRPTEILWNGISYSHTGDILTESPSGFQDSGMLETDPEAEFYAEDEGSRGYSVYTSSEDDSVLYLAVPEGFLAYRK